MKEHDLQNLTQFPLSQLSSALLFSTSSDLPFSTSSALPRQRVVCLLTNLPSLSHQCCIALLLPISLAGTNHLAFSTHLCTCFQITLSDLGLPLAITKCNRQILQTQSLFIIPTCLKMLKIANLC